MILNTIELGANLEKWKQTGEPESWVRNHLAGWNHNDWLELLNILNKSQYWPMEEAAIGGLIEKIRGGILHQNSSKFENYSEPIKSLIKLKTYLIECLETTKQVSCETVCSHLNHPSMRRIGGWDAIVEGTTNDIIDHIWASFELTARLQAMRPTDIGVRFKTDSFYDPPEHLSCILMEMQLSSRETSYGKHLRIHELRLYRIAPGSSKCMLATYLEDVNKINSGSIRPRNEQGIPVFHA